MIWLGRCTAAPGRIHIMRCDKFMRQPKNIIEKRKKNRIIVLLVILPCVINREII